MNTMMGRWQQKTSVLFFLAALIGCTRSSDGLVGLHGSVPVDYTLIACSSTAVIIKILLANNTGRTVTFAEKQCPWEVGQRHTCLIGLRHDLFSTRLTPMPEIGHPPYDVRNLREGDRIEEYIRLDYCLPELLLSLRNHDVSLFWTYEPIDTEGVSFPRSGDWLLIRKLPLVGDQGTGSQAIRAHQ
jgi:hypothetical protein